MPRLSRCPLATLALAGWAATLGHPALAETAKAAPDQATQAATPEPLTVPGQAGAYLAARSASAGNDFAGAVEWYGKALALDPANLQLLDGAVTARLSVGDIAGAADAARSLVSAGSKSQAAYLAILAANAKSGDFAAILKDAEAGHSIGALLDSLVKAWAEVGGGKMTDALADFDAIAKAKGIGAFGLYHKALALASVGDFEGADAILSGKTAGQINLTRGGVIAHVQILSQLERNSDAVSLLDQSFGTQNDPAIGALRRRLQAGEPIPFDAVHNATDGLAEVFFTLATALNGQADESYTLLYTRIAADLRPDNVDALLMTARLLEHLGQYDLATTAYASVPDTDPNFILAVIGRANALVAAGHPDEAVNILQDLSKANPKEPSVQAAFGDALRRQERFAEAIPVYDTAISLIGAASWPLYYSRAICEQEVGDWPKAEADFRKALEIDPDQPQILNYLGYSYVDRGENLDEALKLIQHAVAISPDEGYIVDSLAWALYRLGRAKEAVVPMEKASLLEPVDPIVTDHLGDVYWAVGRHREAEFQWHRALSYNPEEKDATRIRRKLEVGLDAVLAEEAKAPKADQSGTGNGD